MNKHRWIAKWSRWLHIYLSMISMGAILFFSVTGLTLNHPDWFFDERTMTEQGSIDPTWLNLSNPTPAEWDQNDFGFKIDKLTVVEHLRGKHRIGGKLAEFLAFEDECEVTFQGPGYGAIARIHRDSGKYQISITQNDLISVLNDLHKGRHTGPMWSCFIDISAIVSACVALSGFALIFYLKLNRPLRLWIAGAGILLAIAIALLAV